MAAIDKKRLPVIAAAVVLAGMIPSIIMLVVAKDLHIAKVDDRPYVVSSAIDADRQALAKLRTRGFRFDVEVSGDTVVATMSGGLPEHPRIVIQRPDDAQADRVFTWEKSSDPLPMVLGRSGRWHVRLEGTVDGVTARLIETSIDIGTASHALPNR